MFKPRPLEFGLLCAALLSVVGVVVPVADRVRHRSDCVKCLENLRVIGEAIREWSLAHDYALPPGKGMSGFSNSTDGNPLPGNLFAIEPGLNALWDKGRGVIRDPSVFVCPGDRGIEPPPAVGEDFTSPGQLSYAMTGRIHPTDAPNKVIVADKSDRTRPDGRTIPSANHGHRHVNVLFFDGATGSFGSPFLPPGAGSDPGSIYIKETGDPDDTFIE